MPALSPFTICRDVTLPRSTLWDQVMTIRGAYQSQSGRDLDPMDAVRVLDQLRQDRVDVADPLAPAPIPVEYGELACWLTESGYDAAGVHLAIRWVEEKGSARGAPCIDPEDRSYVDAIIATIHAAA